ncbi:MAG TPA: ATP-binding protein [Streptosporangiaceae bacterium]|nr:ATP-binding protein [Streptosporangiaceae bacterium]
MSECDVVPHALAGPPAASLRDGPATDCYSWRAGPQLDAPLGWPPPFLSSGTGLRLTPHSAEVRRSRRWTAHLLESWGLTEVVDSATLVVSELVTNAIAATVASNGAESAASSHDVVLNLHCDGETLLVEVCDQCAGALPQTRQSLPEDEGGRGLQVVAALCLRWGFREAPSGKVVWCELAAHP